MEEAVASVAVVGLPDDIWGEAVTAFIVLREGAAADEGALVAYAHAHLAGYKAPKAVRFVDSIPHHVDRRIEIDRSSVAPRWRRRRNARCRRRMAAPLCPGANKTSQLRRASKV